MSEPPRRALVVGNFNAHCGVDGWGRPYDLLSACRRIDADLLVLEEFFVPDDPTRAPWLDLSPLRDYELFSTELSRALLVPQPPERIRHPAAWGPRPPGRRRRALRLTGAAPGRRPVLHADEREVDAVPGSWRLAVLSRLPVLERRVLVLKRLSRDGATRKAVLSTVEVDGSPVQVTGVHLSHLSHGSPRQVGELRRALAGDLPNALVGDMNCWGPPLLSMLPGWRRAVRGRSWPAWRPHSQIDHVLVKGPLEVRDGEVLPALGSDHLPVRVSLAPGPSLRDAPRRRGGTTAKPA